MSIVKLLIEKGAWLHVPDIDGNTPLHYAVKKGGKFVQCLLNEGTVDVNASNRLNYTPLILAARSLRASKC